MINIMVLFVMAGISYAANKTGTYGVLPPVSVHMANETELLARQSVTGEWIQDTYTGGWKYKFSDGTYATNEWVEVDRRWYHFDSDGIMQTGWFTDVDGIMYYLDLDEGYMRIQWVEEDGEWYYFDEHGAMQTGWIEYNGNYYYCNPNNGKMYSDCWKNIETDFNGTVRSLLVHFTVDGEADFASDTEPCEDMYYTYEDHYFTPNKSNVSYKNNSSRVTNTTISTANSHWENNVDIDFSIVESGDAALVYSDATLSNSVMAQVSYPLLAPYSANWTTAVIKIGQNFNDQEANDRIKVLEHEMGHALGLSHRYSPYTESVMFAFAGDDQYHVSNVDVSTYNHLYD